MSADASSFMSLDPIHVNPERLRLVLQESGWKIAGQRSNIYVRFYPPDEDRSSVLVPLDRTAPEYIEAMRAALVHISHIIVRDGLMSNLTARLIVEPSDSFRFRAESAAPTGLIPWTQGERLIHSSRRVLLAGAKAHLDQLRYFGNRFGQFANRYLDSVLMGQTAPGSYIVTAFTPANGVVAISNKRSDGQLFSMPDEVASTRSIGISVMIAAEATREAVDHYRKSGSLTGFDQLVSQGVSYEMTTALSELVAGSDGADITVEWDPELKIPNHIPRGRIELYPSDVEVLARASNQLATSEERPSEITVMGRVHLLTQREAGGPGVVGVENLSSSRPKRLRVRLGDDDYHAALRAHDVNNVVVIQGRLEREGNIHWIYDGHLLTTLGPVDELKSEVAKVSTDEIPGQMELGENDGNALLR